MLLSIKVPVYLRGCAHRARQRRRTAQHARNELRGARSAARAAASALCCITTQEESSKRSNSNT